MIKIMFTYLLFKQLKHIMLSLSVLLSIIAEYKKKKQRKSGRN